MAHGGLVWSLQMRFAVLQLEVQYRERVRASRGMESYWQAITAVAAVCGLRAVNSTTRRSRIGSVRSCPRTRIAGSSLSVSSRIGSTLIGWLRGCEWSRGDVNTMLAVSASNRSFDKALPVNVIEIELCDCGSSAAASAVAPVSTSSRVASRHWC